MFTCKATTKWDSVNVMLFYYLFSCILGNAFALKLRFRTAGFTDIIVIKSTNFVCHNRYHV